MTIRLAHGLVVRDGRVLLVASTYASHDEPLWNLPGGRVERGELLRETVEREVREETSLLARVMNLAYVSESYDGEQHVLATIFEIEVSGEIAIAAAGDHVTGAQWVPIDELRERIAVGVVREPLLAYLQHGTRYLGTHHAGISIRW